MTNATTIANYLLEEEDSPALLTLAYWYGRVCQSRYWWMLRRARLAELAICDLLEGTWGGKENGDGTSWRERGAVKRMEMGDF